MKHKVEFNMPSFFAERTTAVIPERTVEAAMAVAPRSAFAFTMYDVEDPPDLGPDFKVIPNRKNESPIHFIGGQVFDKEAVRALPGNHSTLLSNMDNPGWGTVIHCRTGNWQPFPEGSIIVPDTLTEADHG